MKIQKLIWSDAVIDKLIRKHNVYPEEVGEVSQGRHHARRGPGDVYYVYGQTDKGRYLFVVLARRGEGKFKVVTARDMDRSERRFYERVRR